MRTIKKRTWKHYFGLMFDGFKNVEVRLADFELEVGDTIIFEEYDHLKQEYTGRTITRRVNQLFKIHPEAFNPIADIEKYGQYVMELEK